MKFLAVLLWLLFMAALFWTGFSQTKLYFEKKIIPYPFELTGIAVGAGLVFLGMALGFIIWNLFGRKK